MCRTLLAIVGAGAFMMAGFGCAHELNTQVGLTGIEQQLPALQPSSESMIGRESSARGLVRQNWARATVRVPIRQVEHNPAFAGSRPWGDDDSAAMPRAVSALDVESSRASVAAAAAWELFALPGSWVAATVDTCSDASGPFGVDQSPRRSESFERMFTADPVERRLWMPQPAPAEGKVARQD